MTDVPNLAFELVANDDVIHVDFAGWAGGKLRSREQAALRIALDDAVHALNSRLARASRPRPAKLAQANALDR